MRQAPPAASATPLSRRFAVMFTMKRLGLGLACVALLFALSGPETYTEPYPPGSMEWNGTDMIA